MARHLALALLLLAALACGGTTRERPSSTTSALTCSECVDLDFERVCYASTQPADCTPGETPECWESFATCVEDQGATAAKCWRTCRADPVAGGYAAGPHEPAALGQECGGFCSAEALRCRAVATSTTADRECSLAYAPCLNECGAQ